MHIANIPNQAGVHRSPSSIGADSFRSRQRCHQGCCWVLIECPISNHSYDEARSSSLRNHSPWLVYYYIGAFFFCSTFVHSSHFCSAFSSIIFLFLPSNTNGFDWLIVMSSEHFDFEFVQPLGKGSARANTRWDTILKFHFVFYLVRP